MNPRESIRERKVNRNLTITNKDVKTFLTKSQNKNLRIGNKDVKMLETLSLDSLRLSVLIATLRRLSTILYLLTLRFHPKAKTANNILIVFMTRIKQQLTVFFYTYLNVILGNIGKGGNLVDLQRDCFVLLTQMESNNKDFLD
jgi:hypothetical protein